MRATIDSVKAIIETALTDSQLLELIGQANRIVTEVSSGQGLTDAKLKDIETWLTAHLIALGKERQATKERIGNVWVEYQENPKGFFEQTTYGQMVLMLDSSGAFQKAGMKKASIRAVPQNED